MGWPAVGVEVAGGIVAASIEGAVCLGWYFLVHLAEATGVLAELDAKSLYVSQLPVQPDINAFHGLEIGFVGDTYM